MGDMKDATQTIKGRQYQDTVREFCHKLNESYSHFQHTTAALIQDTHTIGQRLSLAFKQQEEFASALKYDLLASFGQRDLGLCAELCKELDFLHSAYGCSLLHITFCLAQAILNLGQWMQVAVVRDARLKAGSSPVAGLSPLSAMQAMYSGAGVPSMQAAPQMGVAHAQGPKDEQYGPQESAEPAVSSPAHSLAHGLLLSALSGGPRPHGFQAPAVPLPPLPPHLSPYGFPPSLPLNPYALPPPIPSFPNFPGMLHQPFPSAVSGQLSFPGPNTVHPATLHPGHCLSPEPQPPVVLPSPQLCSPKPPCSPSLM